MTTPPDVATDATQRRAAAGWQPGGPPRLVFGSMYEDSAVETAVLPAHGRILCIASAGDTALRLAAQGRQVTAVDANPAQVAYVRERLAGAPARAGSTERLLHHARRALAAAGWRRAELESFCALDDPAEQLHRWRERFDTRRFRAVLGAALGPLGVRAGGFAAFTRGPAQRSDRVAWQRFGRVAPQRSGRVVPQRFDRIVRQRLEQGLGRHPNSTNPYLPRLLLGAPPAPLPAVDPDRISVVCTDVAAYLESVPPGTYTGFSLSNVLDATGPAYAERLAAAVRRAADDGAVAVWRSFCTGDGDPAALAWAGRDRALLWGSVRVERVGAGR